MPKYPAKQCPAFPEIKFSLAFCKETFIIKPDLIGMREGNARALSWLSFNLQKGKRHDEKSISRE